MKKIALLLALLIACCLFVVASADEIVLADTKNAYIKIKSMETSGNNFEMKLYLENRSSSINEMFSIDKMVINGYTVDPFWASEIAPGKKANDIVTVYSLSDSGITEDANIVEFTFSIYNNDDWMAGSLLNERFTIYPLGEDKVSIKERVTQESDIVVVDNDDIAIIITGFGNDRIWGYTAYGYFVNKTDKMLMFSCEDCSVNGFMADPFWATEIPPHARGFSNISWSSNTLEENDIETVEEIEIKFRVYDNDNWMADEIYEEVTILNP